MSNPRISLSEQNLTWRIPFEIALCTLMLNVVLTLSLNVLLTGLSSQLSIQTIGSPIGTAILGFSEALLLTPLLLYSKKYAITRPQLGMYARSRTNVLADVAVGVVVGLAMVPVSVVASALNQSILGPQPEAEYVRTAFAVNSPFETILLLSSIILVVAPVEEVIFRGFIQQGFEKSSGKLKGLLLASMLFAITHMDPWSIFPLFLLGALLGLSFQLRHRRVLAPITSHSLYMICLIVLSSA
ncbi:MAG: CPBP family intramembrane glutamic endopeptidase [Candidatus Atabeyarchaeum deiterrae]